MHDGSVLSREMAERKGSMKTKLGRWYTPVLYVAGLVTIWGTTGATFLVVYEGEKWLAGRSDILEAACAFQFYAALIAGAAICAVAGYRHASRRKTAWGAGLVVLAAVLIAAVNSVELLFAELWFALDVMGWE